ncbi:hypothetical protein BD410DRAFT_901373 [Rickenella mellea]|uniref:Protein kinase domain-containing protein n=1 Tax=Rickenella mellea TaxID=50990 RepID=A0A4Y7PQ71_9AGAM|nr:hypothetical protein BD410DRAFT_901373 [Rickenella mellea]
MDMKSENISILQNIAELVPRQGIVTHVFEAFYPRLPNHPDEQTRCDAVIRQVLGWYKATVETLQDQLTQNETRYKAAVETLQDQVKQNETRFQERIREMTEQRRVGEDRIRELEAREATLTAAFIDGRQQIVHPRSWGSVTRTVAWLGLMKEDRVETSASVIKDASTSVISLQQEFDNLDSARWTDEAMMYDPLFSVLERFYLSKDGTFAVKTHASTVFRADLSVSLYEKEHLLLHGLKYFIEWKKPRAPGALDSAENSGQLLDYFNQVREVQPYRTTFVCILSNAVTFTWVFVAKYDQPRPRITKHVALSLAHAIFYAEALSSQDLSKRISDLDPQVANISEPYTFLSSTRHCFLLSVPMRADLQKSALGGTQVSTHWTAPSRHGGKHFALKINHDSQMSPIMTEVEMLKKLSDGKEIPIHIPELVWSPDSRAELGIVPVGYPINFKQSSITSRNIVVGLIAGLKYIHGKGIVHRDIRPSNLVLDDQGNLIIIDYETATNIPATKEVPYLGGFVCWPKRLLDTGTMEYLPEASDDLLASILVVLHLVFPSHFDSLCVSNIRPENIGLKRTAETKKVLQLWRDVENSVVWAPFVAAAQKCDYVTLAKMGEVFCHF